MNVKGRKSRRCDGRCVCHIFLVNPGTGRTFSFFGFMSSTSQTIVDARWATEDNMAKHLERLKGQLSSSSSLLPSTVVLITTKTHKN